MQENGTELLEREASSASMAAGVRRAPAGRWGWVARVGCVFLGLTAWFVTQTLIGSRPCDGNIGDRLLALLGPVNDYLAMTPSAANWVLISSSTVINLLAAFLLVWAIFGPSFRPFVGLLMLFGLRQICQGLCVLPLPEGMIWRDPGFPGGLVTYGVSNDLFFSGHTALAVYGAVELGRLRGWWWKVLGVLIVIFEVAAVLALRAHWTMDVFAGTMAALWVAAVAQYPTRWVEGVIHGKEVASRE